MNHSFPNRMTLSALVVFAISVHAGSAEATDIPGGTISSTVTIIQDSQLVGDVTCTVPLSLTGANPCISFGADHIKLHLNGHTITGPVDGPTDLTNCSVPTDSMFGVGILVNGRTDVKIVGPGVIQKFERWGILLLSSDHVTVRKVTATRNCWSGMQTIGTSESHFEENVWANNAARSNGAACGGICLANSNKNVVHKSKFYGNGSVDTPNGNVDFGIGFEGSSSENRVEENEVGGNTNGILFFNTSSNNVVRENIIAGNPPGQVLKTFVASNQQGADIAFRPNFSGANNIIEDNFCLTYIQGSGPATPSCPNIHAKDSDDDEARNRQPNHLKGQEESNGAITTELPVQIVSAIALLLVIPIRRLAGL